MPRRALPPLALLAAALGGALGACEYDRTQIAQGTPRLAVHAVLQPGREQQVVLVERVLNGSRAVLPRGPFDPNDPIVTGSGDAVRGARVVVYGPGPGDSVVALETATRSPSGRGGGVYVFNGASACRAYCLAVVPGARYRLRVEAGGAVVTGATTVPDHLWPGGLTGLRFDRERDTLRVAWEPVPLARRYELRVGAPRGAYTAFLAETSVAVSGLLRNPFAETIPSVFMPGFVETLSIAAVDSNYYDYYRSSNDPFTGTGLINRLEGGLGVFGSWTRVRELSLQVEAPREEPVEGTWTSDAGTLPHAFSLYVESRSGGTSYLSGAVLEARQLTATNVVGLLSGSTITLVFLRSPFVTDTAAVLRGTLGADGRIVGSASGLPGPQRWAKSP